MRSERFSAIKLMAAASVFCAVFVGCAHASPIDIGANFTFSSAGGMTASPCGTTCTINDPGVAGNGVLQSNFTVNGDFTAQVTQSGNRGGSPQFNIGFEVGFAGGNETNQFLIINDANQPVPPEWGGSLNYPSGPPTVFGDAFLLGQFSAQLKLQRVGDTVKLFYDNTLIASDTGSNYLGAATLLFVVSDAFNNSPAGFATWDNLTVNTAATPLPAALPLFATGLGAIGLLARRRKRKNASAVRAAA